MILPPELVRVKRTKEALIPHLLWEESSSIAKTLIAVYSEHLDKSRGKLIEALRSCEELGYDHRLVRGLSSILETYCIYGTRSMVSPLNVREELFKAASKQPIMTQATRSTIILEVAQRMGVTPSDIEESIYADIDEEQKLTDFKTPSPEQLLGLYNFSLIGSILVHSTRVITTFIGEGASIQKAAQALGEFDLRRGEQQKLTIYLNKMNNKGAHGRKIETFLNSLLQLNDWSLTAEIKYPESHTEARQMNLNSKLHSNMILRAQLNDNNVIEIEAPAKKYNFGDIVLISETANRLGLTNKELLTKIKEEKKEYVHLPGLLITNEKLNSLKAKLSEIGGDELSLFKKALTKNGVKEPIPVLEAMGYTIDPDPEEKVIRVRKLRKAASI